MLNLVDVKLQQKQKIAVCTSKGFADKAPFQEFSQPRPQPQPLNELYI